MKIYDYKNKKEIDIEKEKEIIEIMSEEINRKPIKLSKKEGQL